MKQFWPHRSKSNLLCLGQRADSVEMKINAAIYHYSQFVTIAISLGLRDVQALGDTRRRQLQRMANNNKCLCLFVFVFVFVFVCVINVKLRQSESLNKCLALGLSQAKRNSVYGNCNFLLAYQLQLPAATSSELIQLR